jgi:predicted transcriptional regulator
VSRSEPQRRHPGELEAGVLAVLWAAERALTPGDVQCALPGDLARTTVTTILARLHDKGVLVRTRVGRGFAYRPAREAQDAPGLAARRMRSELDKEADRQTVLTRFVSGLSQDDEELLRALLLEAARQDGRSDGRPDSPSQGRSDGRPERDDGRAAGYGAAS